MQEIKETQVGSLGWKDPLEEGMATHFSILAWRIAWTEEPGRLPSTGSQRVGHDWATDTFTSPCLIFSFHSSAYFCYTHYDLGSPLCTFHTSVHSPRWPLNAAPIFQMRKLRLRKIRYLATKPESPGTQLCSSGAHYWHSAARPFSTIISSHHWVHLCTSWFSHLWPAEAKLIHPVYLFHTVSEW